ncbi:ferric reductase-like transmembrane domain-containing protein [Niveibacterium sp. 24ML]|uniref:ferric reductase-like transmembrane domain-containing protein n=1 Tax=Niveibacterium sp. 24ML TaxID=2985512 RepID=UPI002271BC6C|nr:ferric reductase-like transmembrane domain-containing protein [Niveibacterium sp. 24ML]MCX9157884.1 ferric reductase-like transmembrane domain-containing protein [Niveibacterium sp. 24ML]
MLAAWLKAHLGWVRGSVFVLSALPALYLLAAYLSDSLGANPLETMTHVSGRSALILLLLSLAITPLRKWLATLAQWTSRRYGKRLADWNWLVRLRRQLGLWCFAYALGHAGVYLEFDIAYDMALLRTDLGEKPYLAVGALALLLLWPLAITSTPAMMRWLGKHWQTLHRLTYPIAVLVLLHFWWLVKPGAWRPLPETLALGILLGYRLLIAVRWLERWPGVDGSESPERPPRN